MTDDHDVFAGLDLVQQLAQPGFASTRVTVSFLRSYTTMILIIFDMTRSPPPVGPLRMPGSSGYRAGRMSRSVFAPAASYGGFESAQVRSTNAEGVIREPIDEIITLFDL